MEKAFSEDAKEFGDRIVSDIKEQFVDKLDAAEWMSKDVRKLGIRKGAVLPQLLPKATVSNYFLSSS